MGLMRGLETRPVHVEHVAALALELFDQMASLHGLGPRERMLLEAAGHLHDIGHTAGHSETGHHVESARMIREHSWQSFTRSEVELIAQIARYHRKSMPELSHDAFRALGDGESRADLREPRRGNRAPVEIGRASCRERV